jgi:hypothetical protein
LRISLVSVSAAIALTLSALSSQAPAAPGEEAPAPQVQEKADDVPAPPMALLFGIGAVGLLWGRRLAANARKAKERAKPTE